MARTAIGVAAGARSERDRPAGKLPSASPMLPDTRSGEAASQEKPMLWGLFGKRPAGATYRGLSYSAHHPAVAAYLDAQYGWLYGYTNFNSVKFSTSPAVEVTMAVGARPTLGSFEFDIGAAYYYYPGELGPERSNYWEAHATVSHKLTDKITLESTLAYAPDVWQTGAWGTYAAGTLTFDLPSELLPADVGWALSFDLGRWLNHERRRRERRGRRASAAVIYQLARRADVHPPRLQARPQLHRHQSL
jgi:hypothetical protein